MGLVLHFVCMWIYVRTGRWMHGWKDGCTMKCVGVWIVYAWMHEFECVPIHTCLY